jgi:hypothetical protein
MTKTLSYHNLDLIIINKFYIKHKKDNKIELFKKHFSIIIMLIRILYK